MQQAAATAEQSKDERPQKQRGVRHGAPPARRSLPDLRSASPAGGLSSSLASANCSSSASSLCGGVAAGRLLSSLRHPRALESTSEHQQLRWHERARERAPCPFLARSVARSCVDRRGARSCCAAASASSGRCKVAWPAADALPPAATPAMPRGACVCSRARSSHKRHGRHLAARILHGHAPVPAGTHSSVPWFDGHLIVCSPE